MRRRKLHLILLLLCTVVVPWVPALAQTPQDPEKVKVAAEEFDAGMRAYKAKDFARAATHFENAFRNAPNAQAVRAAIRSRKEAGSLARAATLCVRALTLYPADAETSALAREVLADTSGKLQKVTARCKPACTLLLDGRLVRDDAASTHVIYASPGDHTLVAGWSQNRKDSQDFEAVAGKAIGLEFEAPPEPAAATPVPTSGPSPSATTTDSTPPPPSGSVTAGVEPPPSGGWSPAVFWVGAGVTAILGGVTFWSGLDTVSFPGTDEVRAACAGQDETCPEYQEGESKEKRTNILIGATAGAGVITGVIGIFLTDWSGEKPRSERGLSVVPSIELGKGVGLSAQGRF